MAATRACQGPEPVGGAGTCQGRGPGRTYAVQTMPAAPFLCHTCGHSGHFKQECPNGGASSGCGGARPAGPGPGRGIYQSRGSYNQCRGMDRSRMTCYKCLSKGHSVHECTG
ncbi:MAG: hypothetical protein GY696_19530 [Gammaproteobacteria bacterium]|nr:hypothetical protein [Gammaproteobacteria bacterium]